MIYTPLVRRAMIIALLAHGTQFDQGGFPYIHHPIHLAEQMEDEYTCAAALLHDTIEMSDVTVGILKENAMPEPVIEAVSLLTREPGSSYMAYIERLSLNDIARTVKIADLKHNLDPTRLKDADSPRNEYRRMLYEHALQYLEQIEGTTEPHTARAGRQGRERDESATGEFFYGMAVPEGVLAAVARAAGRSVAEIYDEWDDARGIWVTLPNGKDVIPIHLSPKWSDGVILTPLLGKADLVDNEFFLESFHQMAPFSPAYKSVECVVNEFREAIGEYIDDPNSDKDWWWKERIGIVQCAIYQRDPPRR